ncbi:MAG: hypothetical protein ACK56I_32570, partial [bacterium]
MAWLAGRGHGELLLQPRGAAPRARAARAPGKSAGAPRLGVSMLRDVLLVSLARPCSWALAACCRPLVGVWGSSRSRRAGRGGQSWPSIPVRALHRPQCCHAACTHPPTTQMPQRLCAPSVAWLAGRGHGELLL